MTKSFRKAFRFCPCCRQEVQAPDAGPLVCSVCDFHFFFPPTVAVGAIITDPGGRILFIERAKNPGKGKLGLPGGFVDAGETGESAVRREIQEEVGLTAGSIQFLATFPNTYDYRGIRSDVLDLFFVCQVDSLDALQLDRSEVNSYCFLVPDQQVLNRMAFESNRLAIVAFQDLNS